MFCVEKNYFVGARNCIVWSFHCEVEDYDYYLSKDIDEVDIKRINSIEMENPVVSVKILFSDCFVLDNCGNVWKIKLGVDNVVPIKIDSLAFIVTITDIIEDTLYFIGNDGSIWQLNYDHQLHKVSCFNHFKIKNIFLSFQKSLFLLLESGKIVFWRGYSSIRTLSGIGAEHTFSMEGVCDISSVSSISTIPMESCLLLLLDNGDVFEYHEDGGLTFIANNIDCIQSNWLLNTNGELFYYNSDKKVIKRCWFPGEQSKIVHFSGFNQSVAALCSNNEIGFLAAASLTS